jgi:hypothetical protein
MCQDKKRTLTLSQLKLKLLKLLENQTYEMNNFLKVTYWCALSLIVIVYLLSVVHAFSTIIGDKIPFSSIINSLAGLATACTFFVVIYQIRLNGNKAKQDHIYTETKNVISQIITLFDNFQLNENKSIVEFNSLVSKTTNLGNDFFDLNKFIEDDVYKTTINLHWKNMFYNHFHPLFQQLDCEDFMRSSEKDTNYYSARNRARNEFLSSEKFDFLEKYLVQKSILSDENLTFNFFEKTQNLSYFIDCFFSRAELKDFYIKDLDRNPDIKIHAPLVAAINDIKTHN